MDLIKGGIKAKEAARKLGCSIRRVRRYKSKYLRLGPNALEDKRGGNNRKLRDKEERRIVRCKLKGKHRSARFIRDKLGLSVHRETVRLALVRYHLSRISIPPVNRIERFEAKEPNDLWRIDIMGRTYFPLIGNLYLICSIDDHNRFIPYGQWFYRKFGINVYQVMYHSFVKYGLPEAILSDKRSQFKATRPGGETNYQWYAHNLGIDLKYGERARIKGKVEALFRFIQRDFVLEM